MSRVIQSRTWWSVFLSIPVGVAGMLSWPFPETNSLLQLVLLQKPLLFYAIKYAYVTMLFSTPFIAFSTALSVALHLLCSPRENRPAKSGFPRTQNLTTRDALYVVVGEVHHAKKPEPVENPRWLVIPDRGLFTGIAIFGAIGTGKTTGCMYPFAKQLLAYRAQDKERRVGGLDFGGQRRLLLSRQTDPRSCRARRGLRRDQPRLPLPVQSRSTTTSTPMLWPTASPRC